MTNSKIISIVLILLCISVNSYAQDWPVSPTTGTQHNIVGNIGEYRITNRIHRGVDITGNNTDVYALEAGTFTYFHDGDNSYIRIVSESGHEIKYIHLANSLNIDDGTQVTAGQRIGTMINQDRIHLHLQSDINYLNGHLTPYIDNVNPEIHNYSFNTIQTRYIFSENYHG